MADYTLSDGREITFNFNAITYREWRRMVKPGLGYTDEYTEKDEAELIGRITGLGADEWQDLPFADAQGMLSVMFRIGVNPAKN